MGNGARLPLHRRGPLCKRSDALCANDPGRAGRLCPPLVYLTGVAELAGGLGLPVPVALYRRLGWPNLQKQAAIWLAVMLMCVVAANVNLALKGQTAQGLESGAWYLFLDPPAVSACVHRVGVVQRWILAEEASGRTSEARASLTGCSTRRRRRPEQTPCQATARGDRKRDLRNRLTFQTWQGR